MKNKGRKIFFSVVVALWLGATLLALELYPELRWRSIVAKNRIVLAYKGYGRWPDLDENGNPLPDEDIPDDTIEALPPPPGDFEDDHLGTFFANLSEEDRATYAGLQEMILAVYDREGNNLGVYPDASEALGIELSELAGKPLAQTPLYTEKEEALRLIQRIFETGKPEVIAFDAQLPYGTATFEMKAFPIKDAGGKVTAVVGCLQNITGLTLTESLAREHRDDNNPMWKIPWLEYRKNAKLTKKWHTNNVGFRDDDVMLPKPPGVFRIACVGGSTTEEGYTNETTYPNIAEEILNEHFGGAPPIEVINCGVVGLDSLGERRRMLDFVRLDPDMIVEYNGVNDICHALFPLWEKDAPTWRKVWRGSRFINSYCNRLLWPDDEEMSAQLDLSVIRNLRTMRDVAKKKGIEMALCSFAYPDIDNLTPEERDYYEWNVKTWWQGRYFTFGTYCRVLRLYNTKIRALCQEEEMLYIPIAEELKGGPVYFGDICHMRPRGVRRKAEITARYLAEYLEERM